MAEIALRTITVRERKRRLHIEGAEKEKKMPEATATISQSGTATYVHVIQYWKTLVGTVFRLNKYAWIWIIIAILLMPQTNILTQLWKNGRV